MRNLLWLPLLFILTASIANAEYWFQSGARAGNSAAWNNGAMVSIQTIEPQHPVSGSMAFWVGENLDNGAFLQIGYTIENQTGEYPNNCTTAGCSGHVYLTAGNATWFYEYFLPGKNSSFLGELGPDGAAGPNGTFHTYGFYSLGNTWYFLFDGKVIGKVDLGTDSSGPNPPVAIAELANSSGYESYMKPVIFANLSAYKYDQFLPVENAYAVVSYGYGSKTNIPNTYGVEELDNRVNFFEVGSGLPTSTNGTELWHLGYWLKISAPIRNLSSSIEYAAYSQIPISVPKIIQINSTARLVFSNWIGYGVGSYSGTSNYSIVTMYSNITERAVYTLEYFVNVSSSFPTYGTGWYAANATAKYGVEKSIIYITNQSRFVFSSWSNGNLQPNGTVKVTSPLKLIGAYSQQFLVEVSSQYGNTTGSGWVNAGKKDIISVTSPFKNISNTERLAFSEWSNGSAEPKLEVNVTKPITLTALYVYQFKHVIHAENAYNMTVFPKWYLINGEQYNSTPFLENGTYEITGAYFAGVLINVSKTFSALGPNNITLTLPIYNVLLEAHDLFGMPVNTSITITFPNGTTMQEYTGTSGSIAFYNVPYGRVEGRANYLTPVSFAASDGKPVTITLVSPANLAVIIVISLITILFLIWIRKEKKLVAK